jgi:hypothetical protein
MAYGEDSIVNEEHQCSDQEYADLLAYLLKGFIV